jgi:hypothetical protein
MAKDPAQRYQSAADMRTDIQRALSGVPVAAPRTMGYAATQRMAVGPTRAIPGYEYGPEEGDYTEDEPSGQYLPRPQPIRKKFTPRHRRSPETPQ